MKIIAFDSSGMVASVAYLEDGVVVAEYTMNHKKTHSQTLLPMLDRIVTDAEIELSEIDAIAVAAGPGSFTGLRIGAATVKGLGLALEKPVIPVPTCEGLAYNLAGAAGLVVPIMDARRGQVYTGIYRSGSSAVILSGEAAKEPLTESKDSSALTVIEDQMAVSIEELLEKLAGYGEPVTFLGDGVQVFCSVIEEKCKVPFTFAPPQSALQRAASVGALAEMYAEADKNVMLPADDLRPIYLRKSQAEREHEAAAKKRLAQDLETVADMEKELFSDAWSPDTLKDSIKYTYNHILLIDTEGNIRPLVPEEDVADSFVVGEEESVTAGYLIYADPADTAELHRIAILPDYRRNGLAKKLMQEMLRRCGHTEENAGEEQTLGKLPIMLEVRAGNAPAIALYQAFQFVQVSVRKNYYNDPIEDAIIMQIN